MVKVLNVMDEIGRVREVSPGIYESGYWTNPDKNCVVIRIFAKDKGPSILGGRIIAVREEIRTNPDKMPRDRKVKIFTFEDDLSQHGRQRPDQFRPNGCYACIED